MALDSLDLANLFFERLNETGLSKDDYIVLGSGVLQAKGIRKSGDVDLLVKKEVFENLKKNSEWELVEKNTIKKEGLPKREYLIKYFTSGKVELRKEFFISCFDKNFSGYFESYPKFVNTELINNVRFESLKTVLMEKSYQAREKDLDDVLLIKKYLETYDR